MSESTLSISYPDLMKAVRIYLGYDPESSEDDAKVDSFVQSGVRNFYYPHAVDGVDAFFEWSFLKPRTTILTVADQEDYDLPDDCARVLDRLFFDSDYHYSPVPIVSVAEILDCRQSTETTGTPQLAAVQSKTSTGSDGQRLEILFWPMPTGGTTLHYRYEAYQGKITTALPYPLGGMKYSELVKKSCLAVAEQEANDEIGIHSQQFERALVAATKRDALSEAHSFGQMGDKNNSFDDFSRATNVVNYNDVPIS